MPCPDYAALGKRMGYRGKKGGDLFVDQLDLIEHLMPYVVCLEMVPTALKVNKGWEVQTVIETLSKKYNVTSEVIQCWRYGDVSARERLMIIGLRRTFSPMSNGSTQIMCSQMTCIRLPGTSQSLITKYLMSIGGPQQSTNTLRPNRGQGNCIT